MIALNAKAPVVSSPGQQRCGAFYPPLGQSSFFCQRSLIHLGSHGGGVLELGGRKGTVRMCGGPSSESSDFLEIREEEEGGGPGGRGPGWQLRIAAQSVRNCVMCAALAAAMAFPYIIPSCPVLAEEDYAPPIPSPYPGLPESSEIVGDPSSPSGLPQSGDYVAVPPGPEGELPEAPDLVSPPSPAPAPAPAVVAEENGAEAAAESVSGPLPPGSPQEAAPEFVAGSLPIKDPEALLRYALPIKNKPIKEVQRTLEEISEILKVPGVEAFDPVEKNVKQSSILLEQHKEDILADVADAKKQEGEQLLDKLSAGLRDFQQIVEAQDRAAIAPKQKELLAAVGHVEEDMVAQFPYSLPAQYANKPWLRGRANLEMKVRIKDNPNIKDAVFLITVDGYNAPVTAGNFIDLVVRRFYDGMQIQRADGFVVQTGDPDGPAEGFIDPSTGKLRTIPLEIMLERDGDDDGSPTSPTYNASPEELGPLKERTKLPFGAYGTLAMVRKDVKPDSASSQIFWLVKEINYAPTPPGTDGSNNSDSNGGSNGGNNGGSVGSSNENALDGTYAVFGYVTQNEDRIADLKVGDVIESIKVTNGLDNLMNPSYRG